MPALRACRSAPPTVRLVKIDACSERATLAHEKKTKKSLSNPKFPVHAAVTAFARRRNPAEKNFFPDPKFRAELAVNAIEGLAQVRKSVRCCR
jgi:hypothetical protein